MGFSNNSGGRNQLSEINVTPLVDVMLVLLIIFMVAAPMMTTGVEIELPEAQAKTLSNQDEDRLFLSITKEQKIFLNEVELPVDRIDEVIPNNERIKEGEEIFVRADKDVPYGFVVRVFALLQAAGVNNVSLVTDPLSQKPVEAALKDATKKTPK